MATPAGLGDEPTFQDLAVERSSDEGLIEAAMEIIRARYRPDRHVVGSAILLESGEVALGVHLEGYVGRITVCAEAIALGRAVTELGSSAIDTIVAVRCSDNGQVGIVAPCGMCREMIADYAPNATVLMPTPGGFERRSIAALLPGRYDRGP